MGGEISRTILFTGAGFTKNFGGFLAREMWSKIFNHPAIQNQPRFKEMLTRDFDYESVYYRIVSGEYDKDEKGAMTTAVFETYKKLDEVLRQWTFRREAPYPVNIYGVNKLIDQFAGEKQQFGFFFTLNQDLFVERHFHDSRKGLVHPGVKGLLDPHTTTLRLPLENRDHIRLPTKEEIQDSTVNRLSTKTLHYVKLHGSYGWKSSDDTQRLVIGRQKESQIAQEPILTWYFQLFKKALSEEKRRLLIIGYGFRDNHINSVLADSITQSGLSLYIFSPSDPSRFFKQLEDEVDRGSELCSGVSGYFPWSLLEVFPQDQSESAGWREIRESYFMN